MRRLILLLLLVPAAARASQIVNPATGGGGGGSGTVNTGTANQSAYYAIAGSTVSGTSNIQVWSSSVTIPNVSATTATVQNVNTTFVGMGRNRIINGDMFIDQRNAGSTVSITVPGPTYSVDRWFGIGETGNGVFTMQQLTTTPPAGFVDYIDLVQTNNWSTPVGGYRIGQRIEGSNVRDFQFGTSGAAAVSVSFWFRATGTYGTSQFGGALLNSAENRSLPFFFSYASGSGWKYVNFTVPGDQSGTWLTTTGIGLEMVLDLGSASGKLSSSSGTWSGSTFYGVTGDAQFIGATAPTIDLTGVQIEIGPQATAFEYLPMQAQIANCQRYYEKSYGMTEKPGAVAGQTRQKLTFALVGTNAVKSTYAYFKTPKRVAPTGTVWSYDAGTLGSWDFTSLTGTRTPRVVSIFDIDINGMDLLNSTAGDLLADGNWDATAEL